MKRGLGIIFAGGEASRMGGISKGDIIIGDKTCFDHAYKVLSQSLDSIALSTQQWQYNELETIADYPAVGRGGVAYAVLGCLDWARSHDFDYMVTTPIDTPFLPHSYADRLIEAYQTYKVSCVYKADERVQGLHALWSVSEFDTLKDMIVNKGECKIEALHRHIGSRQLIHEADAKGSFHNINTSENLIAAQKMAANMRTL